MEILITTILIIIYLLYKDFTHQKQVMEILNLFTQGEEKPQMTYNPFKRIIENIKPEKAKDNKLKEQEEKYLPLEDVSEEDVRNAFEGTKKVKKEEIEL